MSWSDAMIAWGPAYPLIAILLMAHCHAVYYVIPRGFRALEKAASGHEDSAAKRGRITVKKIKRIAKRLGRREKKLIRKITELVDPPAEPAPESEPKRTPKQTK